ncbi:GNAT family N-acetyltransferase [Mesorhizobium sp. CAU 1741]|uniref:GNAT family N-acetyltransferase n=1 Tax=Mesorhizobium sp. CAU 1741 TaxID=3140366 RepID=UPI00325C0CD8
MTDYPIEFEQTAKGGRYFVRMPGEEDSRLTFVRVSETHWIADHTFVPVPWRGEGIAERLVERLVADARTAGAMITPTCWFVADELKRMSPAWDDVWMQ